MEERPKMPTAKKAMATNKEIDKKMTGKETDRFEFKCRTVRTPRLQHKNNYTRCRIIDKKFGEAVGTVSAGVIASERKMTIRSDLNIEISER